MIGFFTKTRELYNVLGDETRLSILILLRTRRMSLEDIKNYLGRKPNEMLDYHLNILGKNRLIQKSGVFYFLTEEGISRLSELGITTSEAVKLAKEREALMTSEFKNGRDLELDPPNVERWLIVPVFGNRGLYRSQIMF